MVKKLYKENYLHKKKILKKFSYYYYPPSPLLSLSLLCLLKTEIK